MAQNGMRSGKSYKAQYMSYKTNNNHEKNKVAKLRKVVKAQPNNEQAKEALKKVLKSGAVYTRNRKAENECKGRMNIFGYENNHATKRIRFSKLWHTTTNFSNWFGPSVSKEAKVTTSKSVYEQLKELGYKVYGRKR